MGCNDLLNHLGVRACDYPFLRGLLKRFFARSGSCRVPFKQTQEPSLIQHLHLELNCLVKL